jgi:hypothetical protein
VRYKIAYEKHLCAFLRVTCKQTSVLAAPPKCKKPPQETKNLKKNRSFLRPLVIGNSYEAYGVRAKCVLHVSDHVDASLRFLYDELT